MSHLAELYAKDLGCQVGNPVIQNHYFPIPCQKYITIHNDNKVPAKEYGYFDMVVSLLKPILTKYGIKIIQVGAHKEKRIDGVDYHLSTNSIKQLATILKHSMGHVGCDSLPVHMSSVYDKPIVALYAHTYAKTCNPIWNKKSKVALLESHRNGSKPNFSLSEDPQTINLIMPHEVANAVFAVMDLDEKAQEETSFIGSRFRNKICDIIPSEMPKLQDGVFYNVRMDVVHNEVILAEILKVVPCEVTISAPIDSRILGLKKNIRAINYIAPVFNADFVKDAKLSGVNLILLCNSKETLEEERFKLFDFLISELDVEEEVRKNEKKLKYLPEGFKVDSNRPTIEGAKAFSTFCDYLIHKKASIEMQKEAFYLDIDWLRIYNKV